MTITLMAFEGLAIATIMPAVRADLGGIRLYGWAFSAFFLASLISTVIAGGEADRHGVGRPFSAGVGLFALGLVIGAVAPSMIVLVLGRAVQGLGAGAVSATATTTVARGYPQELRPRMFALMSTAWVVPGIVGPGLSGVIADTIGWRWVFAGLLPVLSVSAVIAIPRLRRVSMDGAVGELTTRPSLGGAVLLAVMVGALITGLGEHRIAFAAPLIAIGLIGTGPVLARLLPRGALRFERGLPTAVMLKGFLTFAFFGTDAYISLSVTSVRHRSVTLAGLALTAATLSWTAGAWINAQRGERVGARRMVAGGMTIIAVGIVIMIASLDLSTPLVTVVVAWAVAGLGMGMAFQAVMLAVLSEAPAGQEGTASAAQQLTDLLGVATGTGVVGAIVAVGESSGWTPAGSLRVGFALTLAVAVAGVFLTRRLAASASPGGAASGRAGPAAAAATPSVPSSG
jgi:MFS family permease